MPGHCSLVPSCCGITLRNGTMWLAEICALVGAALIIISSISMDVLLNRWNLSEAPLLAHLYSIPMVLGILQVITSILLAYGAIVEKSGYLIPWIIFFTLQTSLLFLGTCALTVMCIAAVEPLPVGVIIFLIGTIYCHVFRYFITVVYSYYRQLQVCNVDSSSQVIQLA